MSNKSLGIKNKVEPPEASDREAELLPRTLGEALRALEADAVMVEALGREFVDWFVNFWYLLLFWKFRITKDDSLLCSVSSRVFP